MAITDWDRDGDLDLWFTNRNAPQVRYLENQHPVSGNFIAIHLTGTQCNHDAIGARVQVHTTDGAETQAKTLRAGDGFLSQSSKWLHFGLGDAKAALQVVIRWPGGSTETFEGLLPNKRYHITQGASQATPWTDAALDGLQPEQITTPSVGGMVASRVPLPPILYQNIKEESQTFRPNSPATLLVLWASWCPTCQAELNRLQHEMSKLSDAGVSILALSVDHLANDADAGRAKLPSLPYPVGFADESVPAIFEAIQQHLYDRHTPFQVPSSLLVTKDGEVAAIYQGALETESLLHHIAKLNLVEEARRAASVPFAGKWLAPVRRLHPIDLALKLSTQGFDDVSLAYYKQHARLMANHGQSPQLFLQLGQTLERKARPREALDFYYGVLAQAPDHVEALSRRAILLATIQGKLRNPDEAFRLAERAVAVSNRKSALALHALGAAQASKGFYRAAKKNAQAAITLAHQQGLKDIEGMAAEALTRYSTSQQ